MSGAAAFRETIERLERARCAPADLTTAFTCILQGSWNSVQIASFAIALRMREDSTASLVAGARALRSVMVPVEHGLPSVLDTCGTGGDGAHTLNLSTMAAVVVASCGVVVAKHGNRSVSSRSGSADMLESLGLPPGIAPSAQRRILQEARIAFLMAPDHHPALRHAAQARRELGVRTIFNALGPLANPAGATHQLVGVYDDALRPQMALALSELGTTRAWVVRSADGLDELSPEGPTRISVVTGGTCTERIVSPEDFGLEPAPLSSIAGGGPDDNAIAANALLSGHPHPARTALVINAAAALCVARDEQISLRDAAQVVTEALDSTRAKQTLDAWIACAKRHVQAEAERP